MRVNLVEARGRSGGEGGHLGGWMKIRSRVVIINFRGNPEVRTEDKQREPDWASTASSDLHHGCNQSHAMKVSRGL